MTSLLIGAYGPDMGGTATGIGAAESIPDAAMRVRAGVVAAVPSPSWLSVRGDRMVATLEGTGELAWFSRAEDGWALDAVVATGGQSPCHAAFLDDDTVAVACYGDGAVVVLRHGVTEPLQRLEGAGSGPLPAQEGPHAHHVHVLPDGRVLTLDLGADRLYVHERIDVGLTRIGEVALPAGTGPRDLLALGDGRLALLGEWSCELLVLAEADGAFVVLERHALPGATAGEDQAAALALSADGAQVFAGVRGSDRIAVFAVSDAGVTPIGSVAAGGSRPRHLLVDGPLLHAANQASDELATFRIRDDRLPELVGSTPTPAPTCVVKTTL